MHGFIHLLLEAYVGETLGVHRLREVRRLAGIEGPALATTYYPDQLTIQFVQAIADYQGIHPDEVLYRFGFYFINAPLLERNYPAFLSSVTSVRALLEATPAMHSMLEANLHGISVPRMEFIHHSAGLLEVVYSSPRQLCRLLLGIIDGAAQRFNELLEVREMECQRRGAPACRVLIRFLPTRRLDQTPNHLSHTGVPGFEPRSASGPTSRQPFSGPRGSGPQGYAAPDARRQQDQEEDLLVLQVLAPDQSPQAHALASSLREPPLEVPLSLFEIAQRLSISGVAVEYTRLSLLHRSITRLALQGFIESKPDPHALRRSNMPDVTALSGPGILAARRYRITPAGQNWLREMQRQRQGR